MAVPVELSQRAYDRLKLEHADLTTRGRVEIAQKIETARELGDLSENGDYHAAKEFQGKMEGRVMQIAQMLENAVIVDSSGSDQAGAGVIVTIRYEGDTDTERYLIGSIEEHAEGLDVISPGSPLGEALKGHKAGETVEYQAPTGATLRVELISVE